MVSSLLALALAAGQAFEAVNPSLPVAAADDPRRIASLLLPHIAYGDARSSRLALLASHPPGSVQGVTHGPCGLPPLADGDRPWRAGETLELDLDVLGALKAGTLQLSVEHSMSGGRIVPLRARARTTAAVAAVRRMVGVGLSWVDARTLLPERYRDDLDDNGVRKTSDARIPEGAERITMQVRRGDRETEASFEATGEVLDALSAVYYLRAARLEAGDRFCFDVIASRRFWRLEGSVAAEPETVNTRAGKFQTFRVDALARSVEKPNARPRPVRLWFTLDARRLLVAAASETEIGSVRAKLSSVRGARQR